MKVINLDRALLLLCELGAIPVSCLKRHVLRPHLPQELMEILQEQIDDNMYFVSGVSPGSGVCFV